MPRGVYTRTDSMTVEEKKARESERREKARERNREKIAAYAKQYYAKHREKLIEQHKQHSGRNREAEKRYYANNREKIRRYYIENRERLKAKQKQYRKENRESLAVQKKQYRKDHPEVYRRKNAKRRAIKANATVGDVLAIVAWEKIWRARKTVVCHWCKKRIKTTEAQVDHVVPLSTGGAHAVENMCVSCAPCNCSKQAKPPEVWNAGLTQPLLFI